MPVKNVAKISNTIILQAYTFARFLNFYFSHLQTIILAFTRYLDLSEIKKLRRNQFKRAYTFDLVDKVYFDLFNEI